MFKWMKYRYNYSSGPSDWIYEPVVSTFNDLDAERYLDYEGVGSYRSVVYFFVSPSEVPKKEIDCLLKQQTDRLKSAQEMIDWISKQNTKNVSV